MTLFFENTSDSIRLSLRYGEGKLKRIAINPKAMVEIPLDFSTDEVKECLVNFKDLRVVDKPAKKEEIKEPPKSEEGDKEDGEDNKEGNEPDKEPEDSSSEGKENSGENPEESNNPNSEEDNKSSDNNENSSESNEVGEEDNQEDNQEGNEPQQKDKKVYLFKDLNALKADELKEFAKAEGFEFEEGISKKNLIRLMIEGE